MRILSMTLLAACAPGSAITEDKQLSDDIVVDSGLVDTAEVSEPSGEPSGEETDDPEETDTDETDTEDTSDTQDTDTQDPDETDQDGDGFSVNDGDCDDSDAGVNPNAEEVLDDGIDQDCSGADLSCSSTTGIEWEVDFPAVSLQDTCDWENGGNLAATDGVISARREQSAVYTPPAGSAICAVRPAIQSNQGGIAPYIQYDDSAMLVYNGFVLFSTNSGLTDLLSSSRWNGKAYDWDAMKGGAGLSTDLWEWGNGTDVDLEEGFISTISVQNNKMNNVNNISVANNEISFTWVTFGDNDSIYNSGDGADCWHTGMSFTVEVELAQ